MLAHIADGASNREIADADGAGREDGPQLRLERPRQARRSRAAPRPPTTRSATDCPSSRERGMRRAARATRRRLVLLLPPAASLTPSPTPATTPTATASHSRRRRDDGRARTDSAAPTTEPDARAGAVARGAGRVRRSGRQRSSHADGSATRRRDPRHGHQPGPTNRIDELVLRWPTELGADASARPVRARREERIRDGGPPLVQEWTKWVVGAGRAGRAGGHDLARLGPAAAAARRSRSRSSSLRVADGPVAFDLQLLADNAILRPRKRRAGGAARRGALMPAHPARAGPMRTPSSTSGSSAAIDPDRKVLAALERIVPLSGKRIADVGTGIGHYPMLLARRTGRTYGIESDPALLAEARRRARRCAPAEHPHRRGPADRAAAAGRRRRHRADVPGSTRTTPRCRPSARRCASCVRGAG